VLSGGGKTGEGYLEIVFACGQIGQRKDPAVIGKGGMAIAFNPNGDGCGGLSVGGQHLTFDRRGGFAGPAC